LSASALGSWLSSAGATFLLIALAEFGDKSQLVCMTLAARHRGLPVILGASDRLRHPQPASRPVRRGCGGLVAGMAGHTSRGGCYLPRFGISACAIRKKIEDESVEEKAGHSVFATTFLLIFLAEFGDKTQIAVAGMGSAINTAAVWLGATLALTFTSVLAVIAGRNFLHRLPLLWIHRISGAFFLLLAGLAIARLIYSGL
jgi:putative Ca2+/H+ antiporter (TMEM165/GDT1 family)